MSRCCCARRKDFAFAINSTAMTDLDYASAQQRLATYTIFPQATTHFLWRLGDDDPAHEARASIGLIKRPYFYGRSGLWLSACCSRRCYLSLRTRSG